MNIEEENLCLWLHGGWSKLFMSNCPNYGIKDDCEKCIDSLQTRLWRISTAEEIFGTEWKQKKGE
jgi:hypothetical protein